MKSIVNQFFGVNPEDNFREYEKFRTIDPTVFLGYEQINWNNVASLTGAPNLYSSNSDRIDFCDYAKAVTGDYLPNTPQLLGDCVAASYEVVSEHLNCYEIYDGELQVFHQHYRPWLYGAGRVYIGGNKINGDGSLAPWQVKAGATYGVLREGLTGLPKYSKNVGQQWGSSRSVLDQWKDQAKDFLVTNSVDIKSFDQACDAMINGKMPMIIASNQGFRMELNIDRQANKSWFVPSGTWGHQMGILAIEKSGRYPGLRVHNQWGLNAHRGQLDGPDGTGWVTPEFFNKWVKQQWCVCMAIGNFNAWKLDLSDLSISPFK